MLVEQVFQAWLFPDPISARDNIAQDGENITEGILNVQIVSGTDIYEGPQQQIDVGQFTIVTRNPAMDPKINPNLKYDSTIKFYDTRNDGEFFRGFVTDIEVEYQREDNPIITITGTDIFGAMQRVVVDQATHDAIKAESTGPTWSGITFTEFMPFMYNFSSKYLDVGENYIGPPGYPTPQGFWFPSSQSFGEIGFGNLFYSPAKYIPQVGETYLDIITKYAQTNLTSFSANSGLGDPLSFNFIGVRSFPKYDGNYWYPQEDPVTVYTNYDFSYDPIDNKSYESILIDNGYNRVINQLDISNESRYVDAGEVKSNTLNFTRTSAESIENYAISATSVSTIYPEDGSLPESSWANRYSENIFQLVQFPAQEIKQITFNNARAEMIEDGFTYSDYTLDRLVRIKHKVNDNEIIDRIYNIAGISHNIAPDKWEMTFIFKPSKEEFVYNYQGQLPTIQMNSTTGDTNFNFTATLVDYDPATVSNVIWALSATSSNSVSEIWPYVVSGAFYKDNQVRNGTTQTWNFDDDGILAPYSFDSVNIPPIDNRYGGYGVGIWHVYAFLFLSNRFMVVLQQELTVGTPSVEADFGWTQNLTNNFGGVAFIDTSVNNETGEPDSYLWDFGDGNTSTLKNPTHIYDPAPSETEYDVSLTVYAFGPGGTKVYNTKTETITLVQPTMVPDFTYTQSQQTITFTNTSTNVGFEEPDAYFWDFGDGTTSTLKNPVKTYGVSENVSTSFSVTLTTKNIWEQTASVTKTVTVLAINNSGTFPVRYIKFKIDNYTPPGTIGSITSRTITPVMQFLKALTSGTGANLSYLKPLYGFSDNYIPTVLFYASGGQSVQESLGWEYNLTRDPAITSPNAYGDGVIAKRVRTLRWELVVDLGASIYTINDLNLIFQDLLDADTGILEIEDFYPKITVEFANTIGSYTPNPSGVFGPPTLNGDWVNVGYYKLDGGRMDPTKPDGVRTSTTKSMFKMRPLPLNIPYFNYTFNDKIVSFTSVETADSYAWTFGDGTTSTLKDPVKTYAAYGTYNVTLAVTNGGVVTRTTTEPVIVQAPII